MKIYNPEERISCSFCGCEHGQPSASAKVELHTTEEVPARVVTSEWPIGNIETIPAHKEPIPPELRLRCRNCNALLLSQKKLSTLPIQEGCKRIPNTYWSSK